MQWHWNQNCAATRGKDGLQRLAVFARLPSSNTGIRVPADLANWASYPINAVGAILAEKLPTRCLWDNFTAVLAVAGKDDIKRPPKALPQRLNHTSPTLAKAPERAR
jgi:hypothetical protein